MDIRQEWERVTSGLPWGVQRVLHDTLSLVAEGKVSLVWGRDYSKNSPCLINSVAQMLGVTQGEGGTGIPVMYFAPLVGTFDRLNADLKNKGVNSDEFVSPMAAEVLLRYFAPLRPAPEQENLTEQMKCFAATPVHPEAKDETQDWLNSVNVDALIDDLTSA